MKKEDIKILGKLIAEQAVILTQSFPLLNEKLGKLTVDEISKVIIESSFSLIRSNVVQVERKEENKQAESFTDIETERLKSLIDALVARPHRPLDDFLRMDDTFSELLSLFVVFYQILFVHEYDEQKYNALFLDNNITLPLLFLQAGYLCQGLGDTQKDVPFDNKTYYNIYIKLKLDKDYTLEKWNALTARILASLGYLTVAGEDTWDKTKIPKPVLDELTDAIVQNDQQTIINIINTHPTVFLKNISTILYVASRWNDNKGRVLPLLNAYEKLTQPEERKTTDLTMPKYRYSLLALAIKSTDYPLIRKLIALQNGPQFNAMDRNLHICYGDNDFENPEKMLEKKENVGKTLIHGAVHIGYPCLIKPLVEQAGINPNDKSYYSNKTALDLAKEFNEYEAEVILNHYTSQDKAEPEVEHRSHKLTKK